MLKLVLSDMFQMLVYRFVYRFSTGWPGWSQSIPCPYWIPREPGRKMSKIWDLHNDLFTSTGPVMANWLFGMAIIWRTPSCPGLPLHFLFAKQEVWRFMKSCAWLDKTNWSHDTTNFCRVDISDSVLFCRSIHFFLAIPWTSSRANNLIPAS